MSVKLLAAEYLKTTLITVLLKWQTDAAKREEKYNKIKQKQ